MAVEYHPSISKSAMNSLYQAFPCRDQQITQLHEIYGLKEEPVPPLTFVYGVPAVGKTTILLEYFKTAKCKFAYVNCIECYTHRLLTESILSQLLDDGEEVKCDNFMELVQQLKFAFSQGYFNGNLQVIILDGIESLDQLSDTYFSAFISLQELTGILSLGVIFISNILPEKFNIASFFVKIRFPQYTKDELLKILKLNKPKEYSDQFYENYLNSALSVFFRATRDLNEMRNLVANNFKTYCEPITRGEVKENDVSNLWRIVAPHLKSSLNTVYLGVDVNQSNKKDGVAVDEKHELITNRMVTTLDLPYYAKYFLIASYLASYNSPKHDKRLFLKNHGKQKKKLKRQAKEKIANELIGPKGFTLDRLLAIFYSIMDEKASLTVNLMSQITSLVELRLLAKIGDGSIDKPKYKCLIGFECIEAVSKTLGFNIRKYLMD